VLHGNGNGMDAAVGPQARSICGPNSQQPCQMC
jgi:hypothetical protein